MFEGWVITKDHLQTDTAQSAGEGRRGYGQRDADVVFDDAGRIFGRTVSMTTDLHESELKNPIPFKLFDDDGELYYEGVISGSWLNGDEVLAFAPLTFGEADAGCTEMHYNEGNGWQQL